MPRKVQLLAFLLVLLSVGLREGRSAERNSFEVRGVVVPEGGLSVDTSRVSIQLQALSGSWAGKELSAVPHKWGKFRYKGIPTGTYLLTVYMPRIARVRRTVEVGPSLADKNGRIEVRVPLAAQRRRPGMFQVPADELSLPTAAREEYEKGLKQLKDHNLTRAEDHFRRATDWAPQYFAAMRGTDRLHDRQAKPGSPHLARTCLIHPVESLENMRKGVFERRVPGARPPVL